MKRVFSQLLRTSHQWNKVSKHSLKTTNRTMADTENIEQFFLGVEYPIISYGLPFPQACAKHVKETLGRSKVYVICSGTLSRTTDVLDRLEAALGKDCVVGVRKGMKPHVMFSELLEAAADVEKSGADCIITVGGGSLIDAAKSMPMAIANKTHTLPDFVALMKRSDKFFNYGSPVAEDWHGKFIPSNIDVMCVPTTLSGGEFNRGGGGTNDLDMHKQLGTDPSSPGPKIIIWDPELVMTTPLRVWLSTGMRALDHIVESYCSQDSKPEAKENTLLGLKLLVPGLIRTKRKPDDLEARLDAQRGGRYSMMFLRFGIPVGASHGIGHQLGPYGVPHGETTCVMLPFVLKYNAKVNRAKQQELLAVLWESEIVAEVLRKWGVREDGCAELGDAIDAIVRELGLPRSLEEVGVGRDKWDAIAESSILDKYSKTNPIPLTRKEQVMEILEMAA